MELAEAQDAFLDVSYHPGWTFTVEDGNNEGPWLRINATVPNAYQPDVPTMLDIHISLHDVLAIPGLTRDQLYAWLDARLMRVAIHEHHEWFQVDGEPWIDPHAEGYGMRSVNG